jgi:hypothetical protein
MKCDLCKHRELHSKNNLLCGSCAEMIQRLVTVQQRMAALEPDKAAAAAPSGGISAWGHWQ